MLQAHPDIPLNLLRILVVDHDPGFSKALREVLLYHRHEVETACQWRGGYAHLPLAGLRHHAYGGPDASHGRGGELSRSLTLT